MKIGINGFGRIGRLVLRSALARGVNLDVVALMIGETPRSTHRIFPGAS